MQLPDRKWINIGGPMKPSVYLCVSLLTVIPTINGFSQSSPAQSNLATVEREIPEHIIYELYFKRIAFFSKLIAKNESQNINTSSLQSKISKELGISSQQNDLLLQATSKCLSDASELDAQADVIIARERARYPGGRFTNKDQPPTIPAELIVLQNARNLIFINAIIKLREQLGNTEFQIIDSRIRSVILSTIKVEQNMSKP
jgi:hypothetical protein